MPLFNALLGTHQNATLILLRSGLAQPTLRDILDALGSIRLGTKDHTKLKALLRRWKSASSKRNRIVHGHWMLSIKMVKGPSGKNDHTKSTWIRFYDPTDHAIYLKIFGRKPNQKMLAEHQFRLKDIDQAAQNVRTLAKNLEAFTNQMQVRPFVTPLPIDIDQSAIQIPPEADGG